MRNRSSLAAVMLVVGLGFSISLAHADDIAGAKTKSHIPYFPQTPYHYGNDPLPSFYGSDPVRRLDSTPSDNPITDAGAALGRVLFYDTRFSANNTIACASCHQQSHAFSDPRKFSTGFDGRQTDRNAMSLVDLRYYARGRYFWDERAASLEDQVLMPIQNKLEMGQTLDNLIEALSADDYYPALFEKAFNDRQITSTRVAYALSQFLRSMVSYRSKYDQGLARTNSIQLDFPNFTAAENRGKQLFLNRCGVCHLPPGQGVIFSDQQPQNNGLDGAGPLADMGLADVTFNRFQAGLFKAPSLRNIEYTGPYMHDGRFATLEQVVEHYSTGVKAHPNLDPRVGGPPGRRMTPFDQAGLVAFLKTLSDKEFIRDPRFSDPFAAKPLARTVSLATQGDKK